MFWPFGLSLYGGKYVLGLVALEVLGVSYSRFRCFWVLALMKTRIQNPPFSSRGMHFEVS